MAQSGISQRQIRQFFDDFVAAFALFDGQRVAERYLAPYLAQHAEGGEVFASHAETSAYFQKVLDDYHARGCRSCRYADLEVVPLGSRCALASVSWELLDGRLQPVSAWRESYNLALAGERLLIFASTDHSD
jgi:hypothetical protein